MLYELCALKPPFDAPSIHMLSMKIVRGVYNPIPSGFSPEVKNLIKLMLEVRADRRPDVNKILSMPVLQRRINTFLTETVRQEEFSHTVLHRQNVFAVKPNHNLNQQADKAREERMAAEQKLEDQKRQQLAAMQKSPFPVQKPPAVVSPAAQLEAQRKELERKRQENAAKYLGQGKPQAPAARPQYGNNRNGVSPGMAAAMGGYRAHTPGAQAAQQ